MFRFGSAGACPPCVYEANAIVPDFLLCLFSVLGYHIFDARARSSRCVAVREKTRAALLLFRVLFYFGCAFLARLIQGGF